MNAQERLSAVPVEALWPVEGARARVFRFAVLAVAGSLLLALSAKIQVPFYPVPMTLTTMVVFLLGIAMGPRLAVATVLLYLAEGAMGLPVFAGTPEKGLGLAYMMGPTGGYLVGFAAAAWLCGLASERGWRGLRLGAAVLAASLVVYLLGWAWLSTLIGPVPAFTAGIVPFLLGDALKLVITVIAAELGLGHLRRRLAEGG